MNGQVSILDRKTNKIIFEGHTDKAYAYVWDIGWEERG
jgi:hypothetical protein